MREGDDDGVLLVELRNFLTVRCEEKQIMETGFFTCFGLAS